MPGVYTDSNGNAIVSGLMPYKRNQISLNQLSFPDDVEVFQTTKYVIPTSGSIVKAPFNVESGKKHSLQLAIVKVNQFHLVQLPK